MFCKESPVTVKVVRREYAEQNFVELTAGYVYAYRQVGKTAPIDGDPSEFFVRKPYYAEIAEGLKTISDKSEAFCIGYAVGFNMRVYKNAWSDEEDE